MLEPLTGRHSIGVRQAWAHGCAADKHGVYFVHAPYRAERFLRQRPRLGVIFSQFAEDTVQRKEDRERVRNC